MEDKVLEALNELKEEKQKIRDSFTLTDWKNKATNLIIRIYGNDSAQQAQVEGLRYIPGYTGGSNVEQRRQQGNELIDALIKEIQRFGLPEIVRKQENGLNISITQSQNQKTKVSISLFIESIQDELTGTQLKELQEIIADDSIERNKKKSKIVDKLKQFGSDVASNILSNILTNPSLFG